MMKITALLLLLAISTNCLAQLTIGFSMDWTGNQDLTESDKYTITFSFPSNTNLNYGVFAKLKREKSTLVLFANTGVMNLLYKGNEYEHARWDVDINWGQYKTGTYEKSTSHYLYGSYNPYYSDTYIKSYTANIYTASNNVGVSGYYHISDNFRIGSGINLEFRKYVVTIMDHIYHSVSSSSSFGYSSVTLSNNEVPLASYDFWEVKCNVPVFLGLSFKPNPAANDKEMEIYVSANLGQDFTATIGIRFDSFLFK